MGYTARGMSHTTTNIDNVTKAKKTFIKTTIIIILIDLVFIGALVASVLNLKTGCAEKETPCLILRGDGWCGIKLNLTNYPYICPYDGIECNDDDETITCYGTYNDDKCPKTSCTNVGALLGTIFSAMFVLFGTVMGVLPVLNKWENYKMEKSRYERENSNDNRTRHGPKPRDTIAVSSDSSDCSL